MKIRMVVLPLVIGLIVVAAPLVEAGVRQVNSKATALTPDAIVLQAPDGQPGYLYGYRLAASGNTLIVQAWESNDPVPNGALYFYERQGEDWHYVQQIVPTGTLEIRNAMALYGDHFVVVSTDPAREVLVFRRIEGIWEQTQTLTRSNADLDGFGGSVALNDEYLAVGMPAYGAAPEIWGGAVIYDFQGSTWTETQVLIPSTPNTGFGQNIDISSDMLVGSSWIWVLSGTTWLEGTRLTGAYAVSETGVIAGTGSENGEACVFVYEPNGSDWDLVDCLRPHDLQDGEAFGMSPSFLGERILAGRFSDDYLAENAGSVYVFGRGETRWELNSIVDPPDPTPNLQFGLRLAAGDAFWATASYDTTLGVDGSVFLYDYFNPCYSLTLTTEGNGEDLLSHPPNSDGCTEGGFHPDEPIDLAATPDPGWAIASWLGTDDDSAVTTTNALVMPHEAREVVVTYSECFILGLGHSGLGDDPVPSHLSSPGCLEGSYIAGDQINMTAVPAENWLVAGWGGTDNDASTATTNVVTMLAQDHLATVTYAGCFSLSLSHSGSGTDPVATPSSSPTCTEGRYREGELIQLSVTPDTDWAIVGWTGTDADASVNPTNQIMMPANDHAASVIYETCRSLVLNHSGSGAPLLADPTASPGCAQGKHVLGEFISITAAPDAGWGVQSWSGTDNDAEAGLIGILIMPDLQHVVTVIYANCYALTTAHSGEGDNPLAIPSASPGCVVSNFVPGHMVNLTASPAPGWGVEGWQGTDNDASVEVTNTVTMPASAHAASVSYGTCFVLSSGHSGSGTNPIADPLMSPGCEVGHFRAGEVIQLTAQPDPDWIVVGWSGTDDNSGTSLTNAVTMPGRDHWVAVDYTRCYSLGTSHQGEGADPTAAPISSPGCAAGAYFPGEMIAFTAQPDEGWAVIGWTGTGLDQSVEPTNTLMMPEVDHTVSVIYGQCHNLTLGHSGMGGDPFAGPTASPGCDPNKYSIGQEIQLTADPAEGWGVQGWAGTDNDALSGLINVVTMPGEDHFVLVIYGQHIIFIDGFEFGDTSAWSGAVQ